MLKNFILKRSQNIDLKDQAAINEAYRKWITRWKLRAKDLFLILVGVAAAGFGLEGFLIPNGFIDGGAVGISLLIKSQTDLPLSILLIAVNIPFVIMAIKVMGLRFAAVTAMAILILSLAVTFIPYPEVTHDNLLIAFFGGFFLGFGIGMAVRGGGVLDGTEVLAIRLSKSTSMSIGDIILIINIIIFLVGAVLLTIEVALYSILTYMVAAKTIDYVLRGVEEYTGVTVISPKFEEIRDAITQKLGRGVTIYNGESGWVKEGEDPKKLKIIYTVITRLEISKLNSEITLIDPDAFVITSSIKDTKGGMIKKMPLH